MNANEIVKARELYDGWMAYESMHHGGGHGAKSDDGEAARNFMLWLADEFPVMCDELAALKDARKHMPEIVCLCGSTRFTDIMLVKQWELTKQGCIVLSWCALPDWYFTGEEKAHIGDQEGVKELVDEVHKRKIDLCNRVFVLNVGGYIGSSTRSEIEYAEAIGRPVEYLEPLPAPGQEGE